MSSLISDLVNDAFRENNLIPIGTVPTTAEIAEGLLLMNRFIDGLYGYELGENLFQWQFPGNQRTAPVAANFPQLPYPEFPSGPPITSIGPPSTVISPFPPQNCRIVYGGTVTGTIWFPETPDDGARMALVSTADALTSAILTVDGNGRGFLQTGAGSPVATIDFTPPISPLRWFYRADQAQWVQLGDFGLTDASPFPEEFDNLMICATSFRMCARYGVTARPGTTSEMAQQLKRLKARYRQSGVTIYGSQDFPRSLQSYIAGQWWW